MKRSSAQWAYVMLLAWSFAGCKEDKISRHGLVQDLPVGYDENERISYGPGYKKTKAITEITERDIDLDIQVVESEIVRKKDEKQEMEAVDQDVKLYSWKSQPKAFVHLEEDVVEEVKKNKKSR